MLKKGDAAYATSPFYILAESVGFEPTIERSPYT